MIIMDSQKTSFKLVKLYCKYCKMAPTIEVPENVNLTSRQVMCL